MQLTNTTDYAIRIVCYLAIKKRRVTTAKLASEGTSGGYAIAKNPEKISLFDIISCMEATMAISRCLEKDGFWAILYHSES